MQIKEIPIEKIKPDKNQPRSTISPKAVEEMAQSIKNYGLINPVEVDENMVLVTGHIRLLAAKKVGLKTIFAKIVHFDSDEDRFAHQMGENLQQNTMNDMDIAKSLHKMILAAPGANEKGQGGKNSKGQSWVASKINKSEAYVREKLKLLELSPKLKKAIKESRLPSSQTRCLEIVPDEFREAMEEKLVAGEFQSRESAASVSNALNLYPEQGDEILNIDFTGMDEPKVNSAITKIIPDYSVTPMANSFKASCEPPEAIHKAVEKLHELLRDHSAQSLGAFHIRGVINDLESIYRHISEWLQHDYIRKNKSAINGQQALLKGKTNEK